MFFYEGLSCPHCHRAFTESDDIVSCPVCGAPHHRDCWNEAGDCACAADHGTEREWSRDKASAAPTPPPADGKACPHCGADNPSFAEFCARCGKDIPSQEWHSEAPPPPAYQPPYNNVPPGGYHEYAPFHVPSPFGGVAPETDIDGESARDIAAVVGSNPQYYLPRFAKMSREKSKVSMNWSAFLLTEYWLFHRKQYVMGALVMSFNLMLNLLTTVVMQSYIMTPFLNEAQQNASYPALADWIVNNPSVHPVVWLLGFVMLTLLAVKLFFGLFGNSIYMQSCIKTVRRAKESYPEGYQAQLPVCGGTSFVLALVMYMCSNLFINLLTNLF